MTTDQISLPEGFVEFAMQMMRRASKLRAEGMSNDTAIAHLAALGASKELVDPIDVAAVCCLIAVADPEPLDLVAKELSNGQPH